MSLTRRSSKFFLAAIIAIVFVVVAVGTIMAQRDSTLKDALAEQEGDATVVATVNGLNVTKGDIRRYAEFWMNVDATLTRDAAVDKSIITVIDDFITESEVVRRGIAPTSEEISTYMAQFKEACQGDDGAECRTALESFGFDPSSDAYWNDSARPQYGKALNEIKLFRAVVVDAQMEDASNDDLIALRETTVKGLRESATITWHDESVRDVYQKAVTGE